MKIFYDDRQNVTSNDSFSPSAGKPAQVVEAWKELGIELALSPVRPVTREQLYQVHDAEYVNGLLDCTVRNGFGNLNPEVARALPYVCGSMVDATLNAFKTGEVSWSPTSGAHHAHHGFGSGFCSLNFLVLAALEAHKQGASKVGIIDLDCHPSDGILDIKNKLGLDYLHVYSFGYDDMATEYPKVWMKALPQKLEQFKDCDLIIYNAGVDSHVDDGLGGYLTTQMMFARDKAVFSFTKKYNIPVAVSLAGGYQRDKEGSIKPVLKLHCNTMVAACKYYQVPFGRLN